MNGKLGFLNLTKYVFPVPKPVHTKKKSKVDEWNSIRKTLKVQFEEAGITRCELRLPDCTPTNYLGFAHTTKRRDIKDLKRVVLACANCHNKVEYYCHQWTGKTMEDYLESIIDKRNKP
jgi:hypothetical protein